MLNLTHTNFDQQISHGTVVVEFGAGWCPPCRVLMPWLTRAAEALKDKATFATVDADDNEPLLVRYRIMALPTIVVFTDGQPHQVLRGLRDEKTLVAELLAAIDRTQ